MRLMPWVSAVAMAFVSVSQATAYESCDCGQIPSTDYAMYGAPACACPGYSCGWVPGCAQCQPSRYDHIWDGYCQRQPLCYPGRRMSCQPLPTCPPRGSRRFGIYGWGQPLGLYAPADCYSCQSTPVASQEGTPEPAPAPMPP